MTSKLTRERLVKIKSWREIYGAGSNVMLPAEEAEALALIALAAMESEPVIIVGDDGGDALSYRRLIQSFEPGTKLYRHAQPAPVVPDGYVMVPKEPTKEMLDEFDSIIDYGAEDSQDAWRRLLAAAPQSPGSEPATVPGKWIPVSERMPEAGGDMIVFADGIVMSGVSYAKKKGFYIQALEYDDDEPVDSVTHWMPLPAAPQEVSDA